jgi:hypothetical protein
MAIILASAAAKNAPQACLLATEPAMTNLWNL